MADGGKVVTAVLIAVAAVLLVPAFAEASAGFSGGSWQYADELAMILEYLPVLLALVAVVVLAKPVAEAGR